MQAVILIGIQGSGKSTFCRERFFDTHVRLNLDMLKTRHRMGMLLDTCLATGQRLVIDNTNVSRDERMALIEKARAANFSIVGYYFEPDLERALVWNQRRTGKAVIPRKGVIATLRRLQTPTISEGFDQLFTVRIDSDGTYQVQARQ